MPPAGLARRVVLASAALLLYWVAMLALAVTQGWPAEFGAGEGDRPETLWQWIWRGSLLHAPLPPVAAQVVFTGLALVRRPAVQLLAGLGLAIVGTLFTIGGLGEPLRPELSDPPLGLYLVVRVVGLALSVALVALGLRLAVRARRAAGST